MNSSAAVELGVRIEGRTIYNSQNGRKRHLLASDKPSILMFL